MDDNRADALGGRRTRSRTFLRTDVGNGERLRHHFGHVLRYVPEWRSWLTWNGTRWQRDHRGLVVEYAKQTTRRIFDEAKTEPDDEESVKLGKWAAASQNMARIKAMVEAARTLEGVVVPAGDLDKDPWLFNIQNGTLDLRTGTLRPHDRNDHLTKILARSRTSRPPPAPPGTPSCSGCCMAARTSSGSCSGRRLHPDRRHDRTGSPGRCGAGRRRRPVRPGRWPSSNRPARRASSLG